MSAIIALRCKKHNREQRLPFRLYQITSDKNGRRTRRELTESQGEIIKGPWEYTSRPFKKGLYCVHCLNEGRRDPLPIDIEDWPDLGLDDAPVIFIPSNKFCANEMAEQIRSAFKQNIRYIQELPAQSPRYAQEDVLELLDPDLVNALKERILPPSGRLYAFQSKAIEWVLRDRDVVITTPTASGKSLSYALPVINTFLHEPTATAIYISPLVALTEDQLNFLTKFDESNTDWRAKGERFSIHRYYRQVRIGDKRIGVARYDGSVPTGNRQTIRKRRPQYVLTTPDMLHQAMLAGAFEEKQWSYLFQGLKYVIIDELHIYKGIMGASFANLLRRLQRICRVHGTTPKFIMASATIVDPENVAEKLIRRTPVVIASDGGAAPMPKRSFVIWNGGMGEERRALVTQAKNALLFLLQKRVRTIAFARTINEINDIYRFTQAELKESGETGMKISPFMRELKKEQKRKIIEDLRAGRIHAVIATSALSMGIDIGSLSAAMIIGFPGSIAALWQQAGRAGRSGEGLIILIADSDPLDQFFVDHPEVLFDISAEPVYTNPDNPYIVKGHLLKAARELPLETSELALFSRVAPEIAEKLVQQGLLDVYEQSRLIITPRGEEVDVPFRNLSFSINVYTEDDRELVVNVDASRAQRVLHKYAHYQHVDNYYEVTKFDVDFERQRGEILVQEIEFPEYTTTAKIERDIEILDEQSLYQAKNFQTHYGLIRSRTDVVGYFKVPLFARSEPFEFQPLGRAAPPSLEYQTQSYWIIFAPAILHQFPMGEWEAGMYSLGESIKMGTAIEELCDPSDISVVTYVQHPYTEQPTILVYDAIPGGVGISESASTKVEQILRRALQIFEECPYCSIHPESRGCPHCVTARYGDELSINRHVAIDILKTLLNSP